MNHSIDKGNVGSGLHLDKEICIFREGYLSGIDYDEFCPFFFGPNDSACYYRMLTGRVAADYKDTVRVIDLVN